MGTAPTKMFGYVTTLESIVGKSAEDLEAALGFNRGALMPGYWVFRLAEMVDPQDFEWKDRTRYSDGWHYDASIDEYVQRRDELRAHIGKRNDYDERTTDAQLDDFMSEHSRRLNVRTGWAQIVKVVPKVRPSAFPDSEARNVPQWTLRKDRAKAFTLLADVKAGGRYSPARPPTAG